jgi:hypothetical protein
LKKQDGGRNFLKKEFSEKQDGGRPVQKINFWNFAAIFFSKNEKTTFLCNCQ